MPRPTGELFEEILKNDGYEYVMTSKSTEPIDINFPNLPEWHRDEFEEWRQDMLPDVNIFCFEYKGSNYKLLKNNGDADCNDGMFGACFDGNNDKILDLLSTGDMETTIQSLKSDDIKLTDDLISKLSPYLQFFEVVLGNNTELEYLIFKILAENNCLYDFYGIDDRYCEDSEYDDDEEEQKGDKEEHD